MRKKFLTTSLFFLFILILIINSYGKFNPVVIDKVIITGNEVPDGFMFGKIPIFARKTLKANPWSMDRRAINKLARQIYPGGDSRHISNIHVTIMTSKQRPFDDDIVCYIILFNDGVKAQNEIKKMADYVGYNKDRAILLTKDNLAIYLHVDDIVNFHHISRIANNMKSRMQNL